MAEVKLYTQMSPASVGCYVCRQPLGSARTGEGISSIMDGHQQHTGHEDTFWTTGNIGAVVALLKLKLGLT